MPDQPVLAAQMNASAFLARMKEAPLLFLPIGSLEWHNEHLPMGTDALCAQELCVRLCRRLGGIVLPPFYWNTGSCHRYAATYHMEEDHYLETLKSVCLGFSEMPCRLLVLVNGHGGDRQCQSVHELAVLLNQMALPFRAVAVDPYSLPGPHPLDHADTNETSLAMELIPGLVHMENEITEDVLSHQRPFQYGFPSRARGAVIANTFEDAAAEILVPLLEKSRNS